VHRFHRSHRSHPAHRVHRVHPLQVLIGNYLALNLLVAVLKTELSRAHAIQRMKAMEVSGQ
jgi:hypothetical protein